MKKPILFIENKLQGVEAVAMTTTPQPESKRTCPKCKRTSVASDGYCAGNCREVTMQPVESPLPQPESQTPRTDAEALKEIGLSSISPGHYVHADFARNLEAENVTLRNAQKACEFCNESYIEQLRQQLAAALKERDRMVAKIFQMYHETDLHDTGNEIEAVKNLRKDRDDLRNRLEQMKKGS